MTGSSKLFLLIHILLLMTAISACSSDNSSIGPSNEVDSASLRQVVREYDVAVESAMDQLISLRAQRVEDISWAERHLELPNFTAGGLTGDVTKMLDARTDAWVEWRRLTRLDLRVDSEGLKTLLNRLERLEIRMVAEANLTAGRAERFKREAVVAMNRLSSVINGVVDWYDDYMTDDSVETLQRSKPMELVSLLDGAPNRLLDARLRWATVKDDLPR